MQVSSSTNSYQTLQAQPQAVILPVPQEPKYSDKEVYETSNGNIARGKDGNLGLTPQAETNINNAKNEAADTVAAEEQATKDARRGNATDYLATSSKKSQAEIYLAVASEGKVDSNNATADVVNSLRDVQKQNNTVQAYATYKEAQNSTTPSLY